MSIASGGAVAALLGAPWFAAIGGAAVGVLVAIAFVVGRRASSVSPSEPTSSPRELAIAELTQELTSGKSPRDVASAIERTLRRLLDCDSVEFAAALSGTVIHPGGRASEQRSGEHQIVASSSGRVRSNELACSVDFYGAHLGTLRVARRSSSVSFGERDAAWLRAIAEAGALALSQAVAYSELEKRRKQQVAAWRDEREAIVETLSAEIAHEVRYPINFFRTIFQRASSRRVLDDEDIEIGCEEVDRLERLVSGLRRVATQHVERSKVDMSELCGRAEVLLRDRMGDHSLVLDLHESGPIHCDVDKITQVLVNLLANAIEATDGRGEVGIEWRVTARGGELVVWDTGPGFGGDPARLFAPWYTTKPRGTGLGLAITYRLVRAHGWTVEGARRESKTVFVVSVPAADISPLPRAGAPEAMRVASTGTGSNGTIA